MNRSQLLDTIFLASIILIFLFLFPVDSKPEPTILDRANYADTGLSVVDWEENTFDSFLLIAVQDAPGFDLVKYMKLPRLKKYTYGELGVINGMVNEKFDYSFNKFNKWHSQSPIETVTLGTADCKGYAVFKYHLLRQLGITNVKVITVRLPNGRGSIAGHALILVDDILVLDINPPYIYPFAYLRENNALDRAYDSTGVHDIKHYGENVNEEGFLSGVR